MELGFDAVFIKHDTGFICANEGILEVESDLQKGLDGKAESIRRTQIIKIKDAFCYKELPRTTDEVICLTRLSTGNEFIYKGFIKYIDADGNVWVSINGLAIQECIPELINAIANM